MKTGTGRARDIGIFLDLLSAFTPLLLRVRSCFHQQLWTSPDAISHIIRVQERVYIVCRVGMASVNFWSSRQRVFHLEGWAGTCLVSKLKTWEAFLLFFTTTSGDGAEQSLFDFPLSKSCTSCLQACRCATCTSEHWPTLDFCARCSC